MHEKRTPAEKNKFHAVQPTKLSKYVTCELMLAGKRAIKNEQTNKLAQSRTAVQRIRN